MFTVVGECAVCGAVHFKDFVAAGNEKSGIEFLHIDGLSTKGQFRPRQGPAIINAHIIAYLDYPGHTDCTLMGLVLPFDSGMDAIIHDI